MAKTVTKIKHRLSFLSQNWLVFVLLTLSLVLSFLNYTPSTWLTGWDNLHPEFDLPLNLKRSLFAVWQEYQSLGLLGGMAHAADLPRILILGTLRSLGVVGSDLRYLWTFAMLVMGPLGVYFFLNRIFLKSKFDPQTIHFASFLGGLFYLLNLGTVQQFFTPFETFTSFYGFFPWLFFSLYYYLKKPTAKNYLFFLLVSLLSAPSFYTETLFVVFSLCLLPIFYEQVILHRHHISRYFLLAMAGLFATHTYWLLPIIFFVLTNGSVGLASHINLVSTPETIYRNLEFANLGNLALLKGFWFSFLDLTGGGKFDYLMAVWRTHLSQPLILSLGYLSFVLILTGLIYSRVKKIALTAPVLGILLFCLFFLLGGNLLAGQSFPLVGELFRSPFTKFSIPLTFAYAVFFAVGTVFLLDLFSFLHSRLTYYLTLFTVCLSLIVFLTPAFTGNLISPSMRVKIPGEYFELFDYFKNQDPATRIANFPQPTFWGWNYYDWSCPAEASCGGGGYRGSGFLWYGIRQPILDRAFDVWERSSEKYYDEISSAVYSENREEFEKLIDKYAINWLLIDKHIIAANPNEDLGYGKLQGLLANSGKFTLTKNFNNKILVYKTNVDQKIKNFLSLGPATDPTLRSLGEVGLRPTLFESINDSINFKFQISNFESITIPSYTSTEALIPADLSYRKTAASLELKLTPILPEISLGNQKINLNGQASIIDFALREPQSGLIIGINDQYYEVQLPDELAIQTTFYPLTNIYLPPKKNINLTVYSNVPSYRLDLTSSFNQARPYQCYTDKPNRKVEKIIDQQTIFLYGADVVGCLSVPLPEGTLNQLLSLEFTHNSHTGTPANASITDTSLGSLSSQEPLLAKTEPTFTRIFARPRPVPLQANLILEANELKTTQEIIYQNVQVSYLPQLGEANLTLNPIPAKSQTSNLKSEIDSISISLPIVESSLTVHSTPDSNRFLSGAINCDNFNDGKYDRQISSDGFLYSSQNADACDQLNLKHLPHDANYAIIADIKNQTGLFPTICLENHSTRHCDVFERLVDGKRIIVQSISNGGESPGYTLHLFNQSFGNRPTENLVRSITITPLPLQFLKSITLDEGEGGAAVAEGEVKSTHPAEFLYLANIKNDHDQVLNLYQTRSPYWKAMEVSEADAKLPSWKLILKLPFWYFLNLKSQISNLKSDDWYNSWVLPAPNVATGKVEPTHHLVIFYLPQYLEFLGFLLLPLPFLGMITRSLFHKLKQKTRS